MTTRATDDHVREFAGRHGLRTRRTEERELVLRLGRRKDESFASFAQRPNAGQWAVYVFGRTTQDTLSARVGDTVDVFSSGLYDHPAGGRGWEVEYFIEEPRLLEVLDRHPLTRPRRRRMLSSAAKAGLITRLAVRGPAQEGQR